ncbi:hypothetical protein BGZ79_007004 [Entomortierella chlamydospora]|nr:hypothetical protein BGZ79_007004 [Entomortierella chlamydospora]
MTATTANAIPTHPDNDPNVNTNVTHNADNVNLSKSTYGSEEDLAKLEAAATKIQSAYRGYQSRQELYGPALTTSQKWRHLIDYSRTTHIHKLHTEGNQNDDGQTLANSDNGLDENKARSAWRRAEFLSSRLGKGSSNISSEDSLVLLTEHWLEMSDKKHRYGSNLKPYHEYWLRQETSQNFFYWLDKGDGKDVDLEERSRSRLEEQKVHYLQDYERAQYVVHAVNGLLYYKVSGKLVHTLSDDIQAGDDVDVSQVLPDSNETDDEATRLEKKRLRNKSKFIYVTDPKGTLYVAQKVKGQFHHSSFMGGGSVCAAGGIIVNHGKLLKINPKSGHYRPGQRHFGRLLENLKEMGVSLEDVRISYGILESSGPGTAGIEESTAHELPLVAEIKA